MGNQTWQCQGRQEHGWFGHDTCPKLNDSGLSPCANCLDAETNRAIAAAGSYLAGPQADSFRNWLSRSEGRQALQKAVQRLAALVDVSPGQFKRLSGWSQDKADALHAIVRSIVTNAKKPVEAKTEKAGGLLAQQIELHGPEFFAAVGKIAAASDTAPTRAAPQKAAPPQKASSLTLSDKGADFIGKGYENPQEKGYDTKTKRYFPYEDGYGNPTIGYGHLIKAGEDFGKGLTAQQVKDLFKTDVETTVTAVKTALGASMVTQNQFDALVSLTFNVGTTATAPIKQLNTGKTVTESDFTNYDKAKDQTSGLSTVSKGVLARRYAEWNIFSSGTYDASH